MKNLHLKKRVFTVVSLVFSIAVLYVCVQVREGNLVVSPVIYGFLLLYGVVVIGQLILPDIRSGIEFFRRREGKPFSLKEKIFGSILTIWVVGGLVSMIAAWMGNGYFIPTLFWLISFFMYFCWSAINSDE